MVYSLTKSYGHFPTRERIAPVTLMRLHYTEGKALLFLLGKACED